ncbi:Hypothetical predicted protein [Cloeon dipterum]|uniref:Uncharacterized protein n=1 Tax=Cloeon dipterum TaxID=197152 RepID=A0A8S1D690_9INSE|nr:Hypothetical predicted protein [Cloeon dipterum]
MEAVLSNLNAYTQEERSNLIHTNLSPQMRDNVLQELQKTRRPEGTKTIEEFTRMKWSVFNLMTTRTITLDLDFLMSFYPKYSNSAREFKEVLAKVSDAAPNVQHLKINIMDLKTALSPQLISKLHVWNI